MRRWLRLLLACPVTIAAAATAAPVAAQPAPDMRAQKLFEEGRVLMKAGKFAEACPKLQQSQKLDPGMGTKYRLAECYKSAGLVGSAWRLFVEVADEARNAGRADREEQAREDAAALRSRVPKMTIALPAAVASLPGIEVKRDGERVEQVDWGRSLPVDPGQHSVAVAATGKKPWQQTVQLLEGGSIEVAVPALENDASATASASPATATAPPATAAASPVTATASPATATTASPAQTPDAGGSAGSGQRIAGILTGVAGVTGLVVGGTLGGLAKSKWNTALSGCQGGDRTKCSPTAIADGDTASMLASGSTAGLVIGGAALVAGVVVLVTVPARKAPASAGWEIAPAVGPGGAAAMLRGRF